MEMSLRDDEVAELRRAFEQLAVAAARDADRARSCRATIVPDPEAIAYVLYGSAMQCAYGLAVHFGPAADRSRRARRRRSPTFIERALFPRAR